MRNLVRRKGEIRRKDAFQRIYASQRQPGLSPAQDGPGRPEEIKAHESKKKAFYTPVSMYERVLFIHACKNACIKRDRIQLSAMPVHL